MTLRAVTKADIEVFARWTADVELHALADFDPWLPTTLERLTKEIEEFTSKPETLVLFTIEADGSPVGNCSLHGFDRTSRH